VVFEYATMETIYYLYSLKRGYSGLLVELDSLAVPDSGSFVMDGDHHIRDGHRGGGHASRTHECALFELVL
jgi:hypothetical protein